MTRQVEAASSKSTSAFRELIKWISLYIPLNPGRQTQHILNLSVEH